MPPYFELMKRQGRVIGINFLFLFIDSMGAWLSFISIILGNLDVMGIALYCVIAGLEVGISSRISYGAVGSSGLTIRTLQLKMINKELLIVIKNFQRRN